MSEPKGIMVGLQVLIPGNCDVRGVVILGDTGEKLMIVVTKPLSEEEFELEDIAGKTYALLHSMLLGMMEPPQGSIM